MTTSGSAQHVGLVVVSHSRALARAAGRACSPCGFSTVKTPTASAGRGSGATSGSGSARWAALPISASLASAATSARLAPPAAATAATTSPSTMGAADRVTRSRAVGSSRRSRASSALSRAPVSYTHLTLPTNREV